MTGVGDVPSGYLEQSRRPHTPEGRGCRPGLVVELQGYEHHSDRETFKRDHVRCARLKLAGYEFLPLTYRRVTDGARATAPTVRTLLDAPPVGGALGKR